MARADDDDRAAAPSGGGDGDRIELRRLRVTGTHGVLAEERGRPQPFEVDVDAWVDTRAAAASDDLTDTVDYAALVEVVLRRVGGGPPRQLLESLAAAVADELLAADGRIDQVAVALRKLRPPVPADLASAGVRVLRRRRGG